MREIVLKVCDHFCMWIRHRDDLKCVKIYIHYCCVFGSNWATGVELQQSTEGKVRDRNQCRESTNINMSTNDRPM